MDASEALRGYPVARITLESNDELPAIVLAAALNGIVAVIEKTRAKIAF